MTIRSAWHINSTQTREDTRLAPIGTVMPGDLGDLSSMGGVLPGPNDPMALTSTGAMTAQVEVGRAVVQGAAAQGSYPAVITAPEPLTFTDGDAVNDRIDTVAIVVRDDAYDSTGFTDIRCIVVEGTAATSPSAPVMPTTSSMPLFDVLVPAGVSAGTGGIPWSTSITDRRQYTTTFGGIVIGSNTTGAVAGQYRDTGGPTGHLERFDGTNWDGYIRVGDLPGGIKFGSDVSLYRNGTGRLQTGGKFRVRATTQTGEDAFQVNSYWTGAPLFEVADNGAITISNDDSFDETVVTMAKVADKAELKVTGKFSSDVSTITALPSIAAGWSLNSWEAFETNGLVSWTLNLQRTGGNLGGDLNVSDTDCATFPAGYGLRPRAWWEALGSDGFGNGAILVQTDGLLKLRSWSANTTLDTGANLRISACYIKGT